MTFIDERLADEAVKISKNLSKFNKTTHSKIVRCAVKEAANLKQLRHKNIVRGFGFLIEETRVLSFMELMEESVREIIARMPENCIPDEEALRIFQDVLEGLSYLHTKKPRPIMHRDIKCDNILLSKDGVAKLCDIGLMKTVILKISGSSDHSNGSFIRPGTQFFLAPEVLHNDGSAGRKSDVWSAGCALVEMKTGWPPYFNEFRNDVQQWISKLRDRVLSYNPCELIPNASKEVKEILEKTFRRNTSTSVTSELGENKVRPHSSELLRDVIVLREMKPAEIHVDECLTRCQEIANSVVADKKQISELESVFVTATSELKQIVEALRISRRNCDEIEKEMADRNKGLAMKEQWATEAESALSEALEQQKNIQRRLNSVKNCED